MARENRPIVIEREGSSSTWWFLIGGALGAGLALLFAPQSGERTRKVVGRKLRKLRDTADDTLTDIREALSPEEAVHRSLGESEDDEVDEELLDEDVEEEAEEPVRPRRRPVSARMELEQRLAAARARRQRAVVDEDEEPVA